MHHDIEAAVDHLVDMHERKYALVRFRKSREIRGARSDIFCPGAIPLARLSVTWLAGLHIFVFADIQCFALIG